MNPAREGRRARHNQTGFRPDRGCTTTMRRTLENHWNFMEATIMCFVDLASAFNSASKGSLWRIMAVDRMLPKLLKFIKAYYASTNDTNWSKWGAGTLSAMRFAPAFDKDVFSPLLSSITISTRFLAKLRKIT